MSLSSEVIVDEPEALGFWNRLSSAVVSASIPFWLLYGSVALFASLNPGTTVYYSTPTPWQIIDGFAGPTMIVVLGVLLIGYPVERFWVRAHDRVLTAAGKYALLFSVLLVAGFILGVLTPGFGGAVVFSLIFITTGITATVGRLLYPIMVRAKFAMYVAAGVIASFVLMSLVHGAFSSLGVLAAM